MKTKLMLLLGGCFFAAATLFLACSEDDSATQSGNPEVFDPVSPPSVDVNVTMKGAIVGGTVLDTEGTPLSGVKVTSGESITTTDERGNFLFHRIADASGRFVLSFAKEGYFSITRSGTFEEELSMQVVMQSKQGSNTASSSFDSDEEETLEAEGMKVSIPASSLVTSNGQVYTGTVRADLLYLSPDNKNFTSMMPGGDLAAVRTDDSDATLISYGMVEVSLSDPQGNKLQLREGNQSEMTFPIPESMKNNPPATIPLWYFDEGSGLWVEEGEATLQGDVYVGTVSHFSWHNLDVPAERVTIKGQVTDCQGRPIPRVLVTVDQTSSMTNSDGRYTVYVPENTPVVATVLSGDYYNYSPVAGVSVSGQPGGVTVENVDLQLPCVPLIIGRIKNSCGDLTIASIWCEYERNGIKQTTEVAYANGTTGEFSVRLPIDAIGEATLYVEPLGGDILTREITLTGGDLTIEIELCQNIEDDSENILIIKDKNGKTLQSIAVDGEKAVFGFANDVIAFTAPMLAGDGQIVIGVESYDGSSTSIDNASVAIWAGSETMPSYIFACENGHLDILERTDTEATFYVLAHGVYTDANGEQEVTLSGTVHGKMSYDTAFRTNVTDWSSLKCASVVPELRVPIDLVADITVMGMEIETLFYKDGKIDDVKAMGKILEANGWTSMSEEGDESDYTVVYMNNSFQMVSFNFNATGQDGPDGNTYKITIVPMI